MWLGCGLFYVNLLSILRNYNIIVLVSLFGNNVLVAPDVLIIFHHIQVLLGAHFFVLTFGKSVAIVLYIVIKHTLFSSTKNPLICKKNKNTAMV